MYPNFYKWLGTGGTALSRRTADNKLIKRYCSSRKLAPKRLIVLQSQKVERHDKQNFRTCAPRLSD